MALYFLPLCPSLGGQPLGQPREARVLVPMPSVWSASSLCLSLPRESQQLLCKEAHVARNLHLQPTGREDQRAAGRCGSEAASRPCSQALG